MLKAAPLCMHKLASCTNRAMPHLAAARVQRSWRGRSSCTLLDSAACQSAQTSRADLTSAGDRLSATQRHTSAGSSHQQFSSPCSPAARCSGAVAARAAAAAAAAVAAARGEPSLVRRASSRPALRGVGQPLLAGEPPLPPRDPREPARLSSPGHRALRAPPRSPPTGSKLPLLLLPTEWGRGCEAAGELSWAASRRASSSRLKSPMIQLAAGESTQGRAWSGCCDWRRRSGWRLQGRCRGRRVGAALHCSQRLGSNVLGGRAAWVASKAPHGKSGHGGASRRAVQLCLAPAAYATLLAGVAGCHSTRPSPNRAMLPLQRQPPTLSTCKSFLQATGT